MKRKFQNSDIPYKDRLLMNKYRDVAKHRDEAARIALQVACVALNDTEGLGYTRLSRFAKRLQVLISEYYEDPEVGDVHLEQRLAQLGFLIKDGRMYCVENAAGEIFPTKKLEEQGKV
jgi:hypothetical protein